MPERAVELRPTTASDIDFAWTLYHDPMKPLTEELMEWRKAFQRQVIESDLAGGDAAIVTVDGMRAGWLLVREGDREVVIRQFYLLPRMQNLRIGAMLIGQVIEKAQDSRRIVSLSVMKNSCARALYERLGFVMGGESEFKITMKWFGC